MEYLIPILIVVGIVVVCLFAGSGKKKTAEDVPPPPVYRVTHYCGETVVGTYETSRYTTGDGRLWFVQEGHTDYTVISGTYVLERINGEAVDQDVNEGRRYKVTLFCGGKEIRSWNTTRYTTGEGRLWVVPLGMNDWTILSGTYKLEPVVSSATPDAGDRQSE